MERAAVSDSFSHGNDVWDDTLCFESPEVCAGSAKAGLHFIGDAQTSGSTHMLVNIFEVAVGKHNDTTYALD